MGTCNSTVVWAEAATSSVETTTYTTLPSIALPRLSSIQIRISTKDFGKLGFKNAEEITAVRTARDKAIEDLAKTDLRKDLNAPELAKVTAAMLAVNQVCGLGTDYIQYRLDQNSHTTFVTTIFMGLFGLLGIATPIITSAKTSSMVALAASNYKTDIVENGDTSHSNTELKKVLEDVRTDLAAGIQNYNRALLMPSGIDQYRHLQAAVLEMNNACAFF